MVDFRVSSKNLDRAVHPGEAGERARQRLPRAEVGERGSLLHPRDLVAVGGDLRLEVVCVARVEHVGHGVVGGAQAALARERLEEVDLPQSSGFCTTLRVAHGWEPMILYGCRGC